MVDSVKDEAYREPVQAERTDQRRLCGHPSLGGQGGKW